MRYVPRTEVKKGMILSDALYDLDGWVIMEAGDEVTEDALVLLEEMKYRGIYIIDDISFDIHPSTLVSDDVRNEMIQCILSKNLENCRVVAKKILEELKKNEDHNFDRINIYPSEEYIYYHAVDVAIMSCVIAMSMNIPEEKILSLITGAALRDMGMFTIPSEIINKPGRLTSEEYEIMRSHPVRSLQSLDEWGELNDDEKIVILHHHENEDGSGYPKRLMDKDIPVLAKIVHVADAVYGLLAERPFKKPYSFIEVAEYLHGGKEVFFDSEVVKTTLKHLPLFPMGTEVTLSNGIKGVVVKNTDVNRAKPLIRAYGRQNVDLSHEEYAGISLVSTMSNKGLEMKSNEGTRSDMVKSDAKPKVLAVDDLKTNLLAIKEILGNDYNLTLVKSGQQALNYLTSNSLPDLILMDINMPEMDGITTIKEIKKLVKVDIPVMVVTTQCDRATVLECRSLGCVGYMIRPYNEVYMKAEIDRILNGEEI